MLLLLPLFVVVSDVGVDVGGDKVDPEDAEGVEEGSGAMLPPDCCDWEEPEKVSVFDDIVASTFPFEEVVDGAIVGAVLLVVDAEVDGDDALARLLVDDPEDATVLVFAMGTFAVVVLAEAVGVALVEEVVDELELAVVAGGSLARESSLMGTKMSNSSGKP